VQQTATEFHQTLTQAVAMPSQEVRDHRSMRIGATGHQGDVYIHRISAIPKAWDVLVTEHRQVALGSTIGSRHIAEGAKIKVYWPRSIDQAVNECPITGFVQRLGRGAGFCLGPVIHAEEGWTLTHPEHAHHEFPSGLFMTTYQLDIVNMRQVQD